MRRHFLRPFLTVAFVAFPPGADAQSLAHAYCFNGNLNDSIGSVTLTNPYCGSLATTTGYYSFSAGQGLGFVGEVGLQSVYTIARRFCCDPLSGYQKIVDFKNLSSDNGFYILNSAFNCYNASGSAGSIAANTGIDVVLTRLSSCTVNADEGNNSIPIITFSDTGNIGVSNAVSNQSTLWFLKDDNSGSEQRSGRINSLVIYNGALSGAQNQRRWGHGWALKGSSGRSCGGGA